MFYIHTKNLALGCRLRVSLILGGRRPKLERLALVSSHVARWPRPADDRTCETRAKATTP